MDVKRLVCGGKLMKKLVLSLAIAATITGCSRAELDSFREDASPTEKAAISVLGIAALATWAYGLGGVY